MSPMHESVDERTMDKKRSGEGKSERESQGGTKQKQTIGRECCMKGRKRRR